MSFPRDSAFNQGAGQEPTPTNDIVIRHIGRPDLVEIPVSILENWIDTLDVITDAYNGEELVDVINEMRSHFRG